jgi:hypothetical protein
MKTYTLDDHDWAKLRDIERRLHGGTDRERDEGHKLWLLMANATEQDIDDGNTSSHEEFRLYVRGCSDKQVIEVMRKESAAGRTEFATIAETSARERGLKWI